MNHNDHVLPPWEKTPSPEAPVINPKQLKGLYIPGKYLYDDNLSPQEKILLSFIYMMDQENHCYASNKYLGYLMNMDERLIRNKLVFLKKRGYIELISYDGKKRVMRCL